MTSLIGDRFTQWIRALGLRGKPVEDGDEPGAVGSTSTHLSGLHPLGSLHPLVLAYLGDAVYELYIRSRLVETAPGNTRELHRRAVAYVRAPGQSGALESLLPHLSSEEKDIVRRARNAKPGHIPRGAEPAEYHRSTALEALVGHLFMTGKAERLMEILDLVAAHIEKKD